MTPSTTSPMTSPTTSIAVATPSSNASATPSSTASPTSPLSRSHPLLGSYPLSLLHSRMSHAHAPHSLPSTSASGFTLHIGALGRGKSCTPDLRCPRHLVIPFAATYYDLEDGSGSGRRQGAAQTPWVGTVDLEAHLFASYASPSMGGPMPPFFPGYRVAPVGQLQILVKTPTQAVKVFLVPYDLRNLPVGGRLLARERSYVQASTATGCSSVTGKESLRFAFQLQFTCVATSFEPAESRSRDSSTTRRRRARSDASSASSSRCPTPTMAKSRLATQSTLGKKAFYLAKSLRVVFITSPPEKDQGMRVERKDEVVLPSVGQIKEGTRGRVVGFSPGSTSIRAEDWEMVRRKWMARKDMAERQVGDIQAPSQSESYLEYKLPDGRGSPESPLASSPLESPSPVSILSPLPILSSISARPPSRPSTPTRTVSPQPPSIKTPHAQRYQRQKLRRGSGSMEERELSERLLAVRLKPKAE